MRTPRLKNPDTGNALEGSKEATTSSASGSSHHIKRKKNKVTKTQFKLRPEVIEQRKVAAAATEHQKALSRKRKLIAVQRKKAIELQMQAHPDLPISIQ